jgi:hypothetical protein
MSACNSGRAPFDKLDREERDQAAREAIRITTTYATYGYFAAVRRREFDAILGKDSFADNPYTLCAYLCFMGLRYWIDVNDDKALIGYFFEAGSNHQGDAERFITAIGSGPTSRGFRYHYFRPRLRSERALYALAGGGHAGLARHQKLPER